MPLASSAAMPLCGLPDETPHERLIFASHPDGLRCIIAIHNTKRGPGFGGSRLWKYPNDQAALADALRLSQGMTFKNALAGIPFGGGKAVILAPEGPFDRESLFAQFGDVVQSAGGAYITAEDVGTTTADMEIVAGRTAYVSGLCRSAGFGGDPSPKTAWGVFVAIEKGLRLHANKSLAGSTVAVQGLGSVGMALCQYLADRQVKLVVADINPARVAQAVSSFGAVALHVDRILEAQADVLAPCALGGVLNARTIPHIRSNLIAGAANNQLATPGDGDALHARGVMYLPDFLVNAGGIISVAREYLGTGNGPGVLAEIGLIGERVAELFDRIRNGNSPSREAERWAQEKLEAV
ncbi:amino acid dehydrogenase [Variovorax paradoxus]|uniref:Glu/Leu/Phe/Val family dehydrogenase n=1 Tax=Variovorax paradoxus TaxID=34073 RepID=UPI003ECE50FC